MSFHPKTSEERILHRLKISLGQLNKVLEMVEKKQYCINIIHQSKAIQKALREVDELILENHLKTCVAKNIRQGKDKKAIREVMEVIKHH